MDVIRSLWVWFAVVMIVLVALPTMAVVRLFDRDPAHYRTGRVFRWFGQLATRVVPTWKVHVEGEQPEDPRHPYVFVGNHQSLADIPLISRLPWEMKWVIKIELFGVPLFGWLVRLSGDIPVDRADPKSRSKVMDLARDYLDKSCSVMIFPEGTRSRDGRLMRFTTGAFRLALNNRVPIIPLVVDGTQNALPKHSWKLGSTTHHMRLKVLPPVDPADFDDDPRAYMEHVRGLIAEQLATWRNAERWEVDAMVKKPEAPSPAETPAEETAVPEASSEVKNPVNTSKSTNT